jgi:DNA-binding response OmpR family regulator
VQGERTRSHHHQLLDAAVECIEFTRLVRTLEGKADTPILMVTQNADREIRNNAIQSGINDFLTKPFDFAELRVRVNNMLTLRASQKELANQRALLLAEKVCGDAMDAATGGGRTVHLSLTCR